MTQILFYTDLNNSLLGKNNVQILHDKNDIKLKHQCSCYDGINKCLICFRFQDCWVCNIPIDNNNERVLLFEYPKVKWNSKLQ